jgi:DMSO/TMAO reductase YedYZ molybdopterin-dependent catalytic subunit
MVRFPEKTDLILLTDRPPQLETPLSYFHQDLTPNDAFFVRWHLANIPTKVSPDTFELSVKGHVDNELSLSLEDLVKQFEPVSVVAVNQCSGNSRSLFSPRVPGGQWGNGAMGNARWTGVRLSDLLKKAAIKAGAIEVSFSGLDRPPQPSVPAFVKALALDRAGDGEVIVAYEMNGKPLPMLNGYPLRLVVPGWFATYWVKSLSEITVLKEKFHGFWMDKAYRIPANLDIAEVPGKLAKETVPINKMLVRSVFVAPGPGTTVQPGAAVDVEGLAFDGGSGIARVEVSADAGKTWTDARLDPEIGRYSWRRWRHAWTPTAPGTATLMARATNVAGQTQRAEQNWNRSGYARNTIESLDVAVK